MMYAERLKYLREELDKTQVFMANLLNLEKSSFNQYEDEYKIMPVKHLEILCSFYCVSFDYIFKFSDKRNYDGCSGVDVVKSGIRFKELRNNLKFTQKDMALKLNVARSMISKYEKGEYVLSTHVLYAICKKYGISADYLLGRSDEPMYWESKKEVERLNNLS